jgi:hypothetical protein
MFLVRSHDIRKNSLPQKVSQNLFTNKQNTKADNRFNKTHIKGTENIMNVYEPIEHMKNGYKKRTINMSQSATP